jgi:uncharacterized protein (DUF2235 family)
MTGALMPKNIILLSDGTGNSAAKVWRTNVWRTYQALDLTDGTKQIALYDDGVGTSTFKPLAWLGGAFGFGLKRNVLRLYQFASANYKPGDKIYCLGFSRGGYTIRLVAGLIANQGLVPANLTGPAAHLRALDMYRQYRRIRFPGYQGRYINFTQHAFRFYRSLRDVAVSIKRFIFLQPAPNYGPGTDAKVRFLGVWDTVAAYGFPVHEMTRGIDLWIWPILPTDRNLHHKLEYARQALALDDARTTFHPLLWNESRNPENAAAKDVRGMRLCQVWFAGAHSNVGGGYPDDALSYCSLEWMMGEAAHKGLVFTQKALIDLQGLKSPDGKLYDSRSGVAGYYRYGPRKVALLSNFKDRGDWRDNVAIARPLIHESVFQRIRGAGDQYAPTGIPDKYGVVQSNGKIIDGSKNTYESPTQALNRGQQQEKVWNTIWWGRLTYFATLGVTLYTLVRPWLLGKAKLDSFYGCLAEYLGAVFNALGPIVDGIIGLAGYVLPKFVIDLLRIIAEDKPAFITNVILIIALLYVSSVLRGRINVRMRALWQHIGSPRKVRVAGLPADPLYRIRSSAIYVKFHQLMRRWILPFVFVLIGIWLLTRIPFAIFHLSEVACSPSTPAGMVLQSSNACNRSGQTAVKNQRYCVTLTLPPLQPWADSERYPTGLEGLPREKIGWIQFLATPLLLEPRRRYFQPMVRIGSRFERHALLAPEGAKDLKTYSAAFTAQSDGEMSFYVNDVWLPISRKVEKSSNQTTQFSYQNNLGSASIGIRPISPTDECR